MKTTRNIVMTDSEAQGLQSTAVGGKRIGEKYINDPTTQARGVQSFAAGASCEADGEASIALGMEAKAYQRSSASIGKACRSGLTIAEFNDKYATDTQKATVGYDNTKINGGVSSLSIKDSHGDEYSTSYSSSFASGVETKSYGWGAFTGGLNNISAADGAATFGNNNTNKGINAFVAGANNEATASKSFLFGEGLKQTKGDGPVFVIGKYNDDVEDYAFAVGAGSSDTDRKNGFTINSSGRAYMNGAETESLPKNVSKAVINRTDLNTALLLKSNATNWENGAGESSARLGFSAAIGVNSTYGVVTGKSNTAGIGLNKTLACGIVGGTNNLLFGGAGDTSQDNSIILGGKGNQSAHSNCLISGSYNITAADGQTIFGQYAVQDANALFQVGCGTSEERADAFKVTKGGEVLMSSTALLTKSQLLNDDGSLKDLASKSFLFSVGANDLVLQEFKVNEDNTKIPRVAIPAYSKGTLVSTGADITMTSISPVGQLTGMFYNLSTKRWTNLSKVVLGEGDDNNTTISSEGVNVQSTTNGVVFDNVHISNGTIKITQTYQNNTTEITYNKVKSSILEGSFPGGVYVTTPVKIYLFNREVSAPSGGTYKVIVGGGTGDTGMTTSVAGFTWEFFPTLDQTFYSPMFWGDGGLRVIECVASGALNTKAIFKLKTVQFGSTAALVDYSGSALNRIRMQLLSGTDSLN